MFFVFFLTSVKKDKAAGGTGKAAGGTDKAAGGTDKDRTSDEI